MPTTYSALEDDEKPQNPNNGRQTNSRWWRSVLGISITLNMVFAMSIAVMSYPHIVGSLSPSSLSSLETTHPVGQQQQPPSVYELRTCGNSPTEARSNGCVFNMILFAWLPAECHDQASMAQHTPTTPWRWWRDKNLTEEISQDSEVMSNSPELWTYDSFHREHCLYSLNQIVRAAYNKTEWVVGFSTRYSHAVHCLDMFSITNNWTHTGVHVPQRFLSCVTPKTLFTDYGKRPTEELSQRYAWHGP